MFSTKIIKNTFGFQCFVLGANVADSYQITLFARPHCSPRGVSRGVPQKAFEQPKITCWASGAPWGPQAPSWRPFLDSCGRISGLGSSLGPFLDASGPFLVCFQSFLSSHGHIFLIFKHNFYFAYKSIFKFNCLFITCFFKLAIYEESWSAEPPEGSIFMLLGGKQGMGIADTL